jgi:hypothetical protein
MIDYTALLKKLTPDRDGEPHTHLRTGTVAAVNSDGTLDITMSGGVLVPGVPKLASVFADVGDAVQMISFRGSLLVLGPVATVAPTSAKMIKTGSLTAGPSAASSFTSVVSFGVTFPAVPSVHINKNSGAAVTTNWIGYAFGVSTTGFTLWGTGPSSQTFSVAWQWTAIYSP